MFLIAMVFGYFLILVAIVAGKEMTCSFFRMILGIPHQAPPAPLPRYLDGRDQTNPRQSWAPPRRRNPCQ
jgi:hypothetical protein